MRRDEKEIKDRSEMEDVLNRATVLHLAMVDDGKPYVVPLNFGYEANVLYLHCAPEGHKLDILRKNPTVCFATHVDASVAPAELPCQFSGHYRSVIGRGQATLVTDREKKVQALDVLMRKFMQGPYQYQESYLQRMLVIRVDITEMTGKKS